MKKTGLLVTAVAVAVAGVVTLGIKKFNEVAEEKYENRLNELARQLSNLHVQHNILKSSLEEIKSSDELDNSFIEDRKEQIADIADEYASLYPEFLKLFGVHRDGTPRQIFEVPAWMNTLALCSTLD